MTFIALLNKKIDTPNGPVKGALAGKIELGEDAEKSQEIFDDIRKRMPGYIVTLIAENKMRVTLENTAEAFAKFGELYAQLAPREKPNNSHEKHVGIRVDTGEEITGYLVRPEGAINQGKAYICPMVTSINAYDGDPSVNLGPFYSVIPDAVEPAAKSAGEQKLSSKNTKFEFLYRDASNYKTWNTEVLRGSIDEESIKFIVSCCVGDNFIAEQVGLSHTFPGDGSITEDDHAWCEMITDQNDAGFSETDEEPTVDMSVSDLVQKFADAKDNWDEVRFAPENIY